MDKSIIFLILGLVLLLGSGKYLVESSVIIARHFKIPTIIIGLTIVSFGTSAPELLVSLQAALQGHPDMAIGNVVGSNISNILLVLAVTAFIFPITIQRQFIRRDWPILMFISSLLVVFLLDLKLANYEGIVLLLLLLGYIIYSVNQSRRLKHKEKFNQDVSAKVMKWWVAIFIFIVACLGLSFGAGLLVDSASVIATRIGVSERVISISMVAVGTSLPELSTSMIAAFKKESNISVGNIIGSNIMNTVSVLGITSLVSPLETVRQTLVVDLPWMIGATLLLFFFMIPIKSQPAKISRFEGSIMLLAYAAYIFLIFIL
jgi:cation:H+ antiporter